jgi:hypothetical protein
MLFGFLKILRQSDVKIAAKSGSGAMQSRLGRMRRAKKDSREQRRLYDVTAAPAQRRTKCDSAMRRRQ